MKTSTLSCPSPLSLRSLIPIQPAPLQPTPTSQLHLHLSNSNSTLTLTDSLRSLPLPSIFANWFLSFVLSPQSFVLYPFSCSLSRRRCYLKNVEQKTRTNCFLFCNISRCCFCCLVCLFVCLLFVCLFVGKKDPLGMFVSTDWCYNRFGKFGFWIVLFLVMYIKG